MASMIYRRINKIIYLICRGGAWKCFTMRNNMALKPHSINTLCYIHTRFRLKFELCWFYIFRPASTVTNGKWTSNSKNKIIDKSDKSSNITPFTITHSIRRNPFTSSKKFVSKAYTQYVCVFVLTILLYLFTICLDLLGCMTNKPTKKKIFVGSVKRWIILHFDVFA